MGGVPIPSTLWLDPRLLYSCAVLPYILIAVAVILLFIAPDVYQILKIRRMHRRVIAELKRDGYIHGKLTLVKR